MCVSHSVTSAFLRPPWTIAHQVPLSMGFSRQQYCGGLPRPPPGDLSDSGIEPTSFVSPALQEDSLPAEPSGKLLLDYSSILSSIDLPFKAAGLFANSLLWLSPFFFGPLPTTPTSVCLSLIHLPRPILSTTFFTKHFSSWISVQTTCIQHLGFSILFTLSVKNVLSFLYYSPNPSWQDPKNGGSIGYRRLHVWGTWWHRVGIRKVLRGQEGLRGKLCIPHGRSGLAPHSTRCRPSTTEGVLPISKGWYCQGFSLLGDNLRPFSLLCKLSRVRDGWTTAFGIISHLVLFPTCLVLSSVK